MLFEEFKQLILDYLYNDFTKIAVDEKLKAKQHWFKAMYNRLNNHDKVNELERIKSDFSLLFRTLSKDEFKEEIKIRLYDNPFCKNKNDKINNIINTDTVIIDNKYKEAIDQDDFYHGVNEAVIEIQYYYF